MHAFSTTAVFPKDREFGITEPTDLHMSMSINGNTLTFGKGLSEGKQINGSVVVVLAIHDPYEVGVGTHPFTLSVTGDSDEVYLDLQGELVVEENPDGVTESPGHPLWFDAFHPNPPVITGGVNSDNLPDPEVPLTVRDSRLEICMSCPSFTKDSGECVECGCFMPYKTGLVTASCPLGKWAEHA